MSNSGEQLVFSSVDDAPMLREVVALIARIYAQEGYIDEHTEQVSAISSFLDSGSARSFAAHFGERLLGTVALVTDNERGLPMDSIYQDELSVYRKEKKKIGEVCQFVVDKDLLKRMREKLADLFSETDVSLGLLKHIIRHSLETNLDYVVFAINPKHRALYEALGALQIGGEKTYPSVNQAPALAYVLDVQALNREAKAGKLTHFLHRKIFLDD